MTGLLLSGISGLLLTLGFAPYSQAWLGWLALVPTAFYFVWKPVSWRETARLGYFFGLLHFLTSLFWLVEVSWLGWLVLAAYLSIYPALWMMFWRACLNFQPKNLSSVFNFKCAALGACAWVALEWLRGWVFTGFPWNFIGVTQSTTLPIIQIADIGGVYLISWLVVFVNLIFALGIRRFYLELRGAQKVQPHFDLFIALTLVALSFSYGVHRLIHPTAPRTDVRYLAVQPNIPQDPWEQAPANQTLHKIHAMTVKALANAHETPHLLLWPETPIAVGVFTHSVFSFLVDDVVKEQPFAFILGSNNSPPDLSRVYNAAICFQHDSQPQVYRKQHLVPMGEYVPLDKYFPLLRKFVPEGMDFSPGDKPVLFEMKNPDLKIAPLICFEDILPELVRKTAQKNPDFFVNLTNDGWFRQSPAARQHFNNALFRAIEFRKPLLRVTNNGITAAINENGVPIKILRDVKTNSPHIAGILAGTLSVPQNNPTFYQKWGAWAAVLSLFISLVALIRVTFSKRR